MLGESAEADQSDNLPREDQNSTLISSKLTQASLHMLNESFRLACLKWFEEPKHHPWAQSFWVYCKRIQDVVNPLQSILYNTNT